MPQPNPARGLTELLVLAVESLDGRVTALEMMGSGVLTLDGYCHHTGTQTCAGECRLPPEGAALEPTEGAPRES